jgi:hypothetical protein
MPIPRPFLPHPGQLKIRSAALAGVALGMMVLTASPAAADKLKHPTAVFSGLDKITGRIITFEVGTNETVQFGSLQVTERVCYSRPATETPQTDTFVEIDNIDANNVYKRVFTGWMFAGSPSLHALDHPVYDIWLLRCKGDGQLIASPPDNAQTDAPLQPQQPQQQQAVQPQTQGAVNPVPPKLKPLAPTNEQQPGAPDDQDQDQQDQGQQQPNDNAPIDVAPPPGFAAPDQDDQQQQRQPAPQPQQPQRNGGYFTSPSPPGNGYGNF